MSRKDYIDEITKLINETEADMETLEIIYRLLMNDKKRREQ